jgi:Co/Zn/Cd efflux system component
MTELEILNVIRGLSEEDAAEEISRMHKEEIQDIIDNITIHIKEDYTNAKICEVIRDYKKTISEIERVVIRKELRDLKSPRA